MEGDGAGEAANTGVAVASVFGLVVTLGLLGGAAACVLGAPQGLEQLRPILRLR